MKITAALDLSTAQHSSTLWLLFFVTVCASSSLEYVFPATFSGWHCYSNASLWQMHRYNTTRGEQTVCISVCQLSDRRGALQFEGKDFGAGSGEKASCSCVLSSALKEATWLRHSREISSFRTHSDVRFRHSELKYILTLSFVFTH